MKTRIVFFLVVIGFLFALPQCNNKQSSEEKDWEKLFNGDNLSGWDKYLGVPHKELDISGMSRNEDGEYTERVGWNNDQYDVFTVVEEDGNPAIRISGYIWGALTSQESFADYHLQLQYKWGDKKHPPREDEPRNSGLLYHCVGSPGAQSTFWMRSGEYEIMRGRIGDFFKLDEMYADISAVKATGEGPAKYRYKKGAETVVAGKDHYAVGARGANPKPVGEWNTVDLYVKGNTAVHVLNGDVVLRVTNIRQKIDDEMKPVKGGQLQLQSEGAEIFYKNIRIRDIEEIPEDLL